MITTEQFCKLRNLYCTDDFGLLGRRYHCISEISERSAYVSTPLMRTLAAASRAEFRWQGVRCEVHALQLFSAHKLDESRVLAQPGLHDRPSGFENKWCVHHQHLPATRLAWKNPMRDAYLRRPRDKGSGTCPAKRTLSENPGELLCTLLDNCQKPKELHIGVPFVMYAA